MHPGTSAQSKPPVEVPHPTGLTAFYQTTLSPLRRYLSSLLGGNGHDAQDIAHDAYMKTFRVMREKVLSQPKAYLFTAAHNLAIDYRQRRSNRMIPTDSSQIETLAQPIADPSQSVMEEQRKTAVQLAFQALPPVCRQVLTLRHHEGLTHAEIGARLGISRSMVEKHVARGLKELRAKLKETT